MTAQRKSPRRKISARTKAKRPVKTARRPARVKSPLVKADPSLAALVVTGPAAVAIRKGTRFNGRMFSRQHRLAPPEGGYVPGGDYGVFVTASKVKVALLLTAPSGDDLLGGFHFAPGGNAVARAGGDTVPAINPCSLWDINFRPLCADPRGMSLVEQFGLRFWSDIYLLGVKHLGDGTSKFGVTIADGNDLPEKPDGGAFSRLDHASADAIMRHHGKQLHSCDEFRAAAYGVTEKTAHKGDPGKTELDAPRTSKFGLMQATGNLWVWGHDGDPDEPRPSLFGGSWFSGGNAGSRYASVACYWPDDSSVNLGARGRSDHLQLA